MDGFKDTMTKELDAQSVIDANSAAEAKEMDELKQKAAASEEYVRKSDDKIGELGKNLGDRISQVSQDTHKDCIRVYRNVQASMIEELDKRTGTLTEKIDELQKSQGQLISQLKEAEQQRKLSQEACDDSKEKKMDRSGKNGVMIFLQVLTLIMATAAAAVSIISYMGITF